MKIYVDIDGTLLDGSLDVEFKSKVEEIGIEDAIRWYDSLHVSNLSINMALVGELKQARDMGCIIIGWTNRSLMQRTMTEANLASILHMFDHIEYHAGGKGKYKVDGIVVDNEEKYLANGSDGSVHISF